MALARERLEYHGETIDAAAARRPGQGAEADDRARCRSGSRSTSRRSARRTPQLAGEIADGWIPTLLSPEHVAELRALLEEGAARAGRSLDELRHRPDGAACHRRRRRPARATSMRPFIALYVGGMGSREQELLQPARAALRLRGRGQRGPGPLPGGQEGRGAAALPDELIDLVSLVRAARTGSRERLRAYRDAGVGTLGITPMAWTPRSASSSCAWSPSWRRRR